MTGQLPCQRLCRKHRKKRSSKQGGGGKKRRCVSRVHSEAPLFQSATKPAMPESPLPPQSAQHQQNAKQEMRALPRQSQQGQSSLKNHSVWTGGVVESKSVERGVEVDGAGIKPPRRRERANSKQAHRRRRLASPPRLRRVDLCSCSDCSAAMRRAARGGEQQRSQHEMRHGCSKTSPKLPSVLSPVDLLMGSSSATAQVSRHVCCGCSSPPLLPSSHCHQPRPQPRHAPASQCRARSGTALPPLSRVHSGAVALVAGERAAAETRLAGARLGHDGPQARCRSPLAL